MASIDISRAYAESQDAADQLRRFRSQFWLPQKSSLKKRSAAPSAESQEADAAIYFMGSSISLAPRPIQARTTAFLEGWASQGVLAAFYSLEDSLVPNWMEVETQAARLMANLVGAFPSEVAMMGSLSSNLHLLLGSFFQPDKPKGRTKILIEKTAFSSDWFVATSQLRWHGLDPTDSLLAVEPGPETLLLSDDAIVQTIEDNADSLALVLLSGVDFRTGQLLDIARITKVARSKGIAVGWDLAHAAGNVELHLHDWDVDFAAWCTYKYLSCGPGSTAGIFVHERHGTVETVTEDGQPVLKYRPRLEGWWGGKLPERMKMENSFLPAAGAAGFMVSSPSVLDLSAVTASLQLFNDATMPALCEKQRKLSGYLDALLQAEILDKAESPPFRFITPREPARRGAQASLGWYDSALMKHVVGKLGERGILVDQRGAEILRITPMPLINTFTEVWEAVRALREALEDGKMEATTEMAMRQQSFVAC